VGRRGSLGVRAQGEGSPEISAAGAWGRRRGREEREDAAVRALAGRERERESARAGESWASARAEPREEKEREKRGSPRERREVGRCGACG
jgi:hypothetical protein